MQKHVYLGKNKNFFSLLRICGTCCFLNAFASSFSLSCRLVDFLLQLSDCISQCCCCLASNVASIRPTTIACRTVRIPLCVANVTLACFPLRCRLPPFSQLITFLSVCLASGCWLLTAGCWLLAGSAFLTLFCNFFNVSLFAIVITQLFLFSFCCLLPF